MTFKKDQKDKEAGEAKRPIRNRPRRSADHPTERQALKRAVEALDNR